MEVIIVSADLVARENQQLLERERFLSLVDGHGWCEWIQSKIGCDSQAEIHKIEIANCTIKGEAEYLAPFFIGSPGSCVSL
jgi:hypothetical protein